MTLQDLYDAYPHERHLEIRITAEGHDVPLAHSHCGQRLHEKTGHWYFCIDVIHVLAEE